MRGPLKTYVSRECVIAKERTRGISHSKSWWGRTLHESTEAEFKVICLEMEEGTTSQGRQMKAPR